MKKFENKQFYVPSISSTIFEFQLNSKSDQRKNILVEKMDESYYIIETGTGRKIMMGSLIDLMQYLDKASGRWMVRKKKKETSMPLFHNKDFSKHLLGLGYTMMHIQTGLSWVWNEAYTELIVSDGSIRSEDQLPPSGKFVIDFTQEKLPRIKKEVESEREERFRKASEEARRHARAAIREAARESARKQEREQRNYISQPDMQPTDNNTLWGYFLTGAACLLTGIGLGVFLDKKLN